MQQGPVLRGGSAAESIVGVWNVRAAQLPGAGAAARVRAASIPRPEPSPSFTNSSSGAQQDYDRVAFESDLPRVESNTNPPCQRHVSNPADPNNIAFSDEVGHFEYCNAVRRQGGACTQDGVHDLDSGLPTGAEDDFGCFDAAFAGTKGLVPVGGCTSTDFDFDGVPYQLVWPGTLTDSATDQQLHPQPVTFTSEHTRVIWAAHSWRWHTWEWKS